MKRIIFALLTLLLLSSPAFGQEGYIQHPSSGSGTGVSTASDCSVAAYQANGKICQDTDDDKVWVGTGSAVEQLLSLGASGLGALTTGVLYCTTGSSICTPSTKAIGTGSGQVAAGDHVHAGMTSTIASGTAALGTDAIGSGDHATLVTVAATGVATTDVINWGFNSDPHGVTGYAPSTNGMLTIIAYPTANNVNFLVVNNTGASITPGSAITLNWIVVR